MRCAYDLAEDCAQRRAMPQPERIGLAERLPHGGIALGRALIGPDEHILEQFDPVELVDAENRVRVGVPRGTSVKESGDRLALMSGMFAASRETRLFTSSNGCR